MEDHLGFEKELGFLLEVVKTYKKTDKTKKQIVFLRPLIYFLLEWINEFYDEDRNIITSTYHAEIEKNKERLQALNICMLLVPNLKYPGFNVLWHKIHMKLINLKKKLYQIELDQKYMRDDLINDCPADETQF
jgi:hypothetical protein